MAVHVLEMKLLNKELKRVGIKRVKKPLKKVQHQQLLDVLGPLRFLKFWEVQHFSFTASFLSWIVSKPEYILSIDGELDKDLFGNPEYLIEFENRVRTYFTVDDMNTFLYEINTVCLPVGYFVALVATSEVIKLQLYKLPCSELELQSFISLYKNRVHKSGSIGEFPPLVEAARLASL